MFYLNCCVMKKFVFMLVSLFIIASCNIDKPGEGNENPDYRDFKLSEKVSVSSSLSGSRILVFDSYPYVDGDLVKKPLLAAKSPFTHEIKIANAVENLYVYVDGEILTFPKGDIAINETGTRTKADVIGIDEIVDEFDDENPYSPLTTFMVNIPNQLYSNVFSFYPEGQHNIQPDAYGVCTDIYVPEENTNIWITYITDGGNKFINNLWYYTYEVDENGVAIFDDSYTKEVSQGGKLIKLYSDYQFSKDKVGTTVYLGEFEPGTRIGFRYKGNTTLPKYSTTDFNVALYPEKSSLYSTRVFSSGILRYMPYQETQYYTLGMENRFPGEDGFDCDFNDMLFIITASPALELKEDIPTPPEEEFIEWGGVWLFEDNYPYEGDYDFNDVVAQFSIREDLLDETTNIKIKILAKGAQFKNQFGINGTYYLTELNDFQNVFAYQNTWKTLETADIWLETSEEYIPYLYNSTIEFNLNTYNSHDFLFPNAFEIPYTSDFTRFFWCLEGVRIDAAYPRYKAWVESGCTTDTDWYMDTPDASKVWGYNIDVEE